MQRVQRVQPGCTSVAPRPAPASMSITEGVAAAARRTARLLVAEIRLYHEPAVNEGRQQRNLLSRLAPEIERARQAYNDRVPAGVRGHTDFFHQELIRTLAGGDATLLGNDLTMVHTKVPHEVPHGGSRRRFSGRVLAGVVLSAEQLVVPGRAGTPVPAKLSPTAHPPVPSDLPSMWLVPAQGAKLGPAMTNFVRGVRLLEEDEKPAAALPLVSDSALSTTPLADYARYYTGLALMKLERHSEADKVLGDLAARTIDGHLPEDAAFLQAEVREAQKDYKGAVAIYESLVARKLARPQTGMAAAGAGGRSRRAAGAIRRSLAARLLRLSGHRRSRSGRRGARRAGRRSWMRRWRRKSWRAPKPCSRRAAGRTRAPRT